MSVAQSLYDRLPAPSRTVAASARGFYLNWWRYGSETERLVEEALERDNWDRARWSHWQRERLQVVLERARRNVRFYQAVWANMHSSKTANVGIELSEWPVLEKKQLRETPRAFVSDDCRISRMFHEHTSGTSGAALDIWLSKATIRQWYALFEARCRRWYGVSRRDRWAILGGQLIVPARQKKPPFWVWNAGLNQLYLSSYHLSPELIGSYIDALARYRVKYILGYPSAIYQLALGILKAGKREVQLRVAVTNAEPVYEYQRAAIEAAFGCKVRETYGMAEIVAAASECPEGSLHQWPEVGIIETANKGAGFGGELICTGLLNIDMPLIRYRVGDRGVLSEKGCSCGRGLPVVEKIEGRNDDVLFTNDGRAIGRMDPVFKGDLDIEEAQIIQSSFSEVLVKYVPGTGFGPDQAKSLIARIHARLGDIQVTLQEVPVIPRTSRGKFKAVVCNLPAELRRELEPGRWELNN